MGYDDILRSMMRERSSQGDVQALLRNGLTADAIDEASRIVVLQFWRNLGPARMDLPLGFCDARSVRLDEAYAFTIDDYAGAGGPSFEALAIIPSDPGRHEWYGFPELAGRAAALQERVAAGVEVVSVCDTKERGSDLHQVPAVSAVVEVEHGDAAVVDEQVLREHVAMDDPEPFGSGPESVEPVDRGLTEGRHDPTVVVVEERSVPERAEDRIVAEEGVKVPAEADEVVSMDPGAAVELQPADQGHPDKSSEPPRSTLVTSGDTDLVKCSGQTTLKLRTRPSHARNDRHARR